MGNAPKKSVAQSSTTFSLAWAKENVDLFARSVVEMILESIERDVPLVWTKGPGEGNITATLHYTTDPAKGPML